MCTRCYVHSLLCGCVSSACSCERNWSSYDFIHNRRRNRLTPARARDLVFVFTNGRLVRKMAVGEEGFIGWDEEEEMEGSGSEGEGEEGEEGEEGGEGEGEAEGVRVREGRERRGAAVRLRGEGNV